MSQGLTPSQVLVNETVKKMRLGDLSGSLLAATRAIQEDKGNTHAWGVRAAVSNRLKNYDAAISDATEALKLEPKNVPALLERGYAQLNLSNYSAALEDIGAALKIEPMNALAYLYRGMVFEKLARFTEALTDYETAAKLDPSLRHFLEEAKDRILGRKKGAGGGRGLSVKRVAFWAVPVGLALLLILIGVWRRKGDVRESRSELVAGADTDGEATAALAEAQGSGPVGPGSLLGGTYRVTRELGRGGMGVVYEAMDE
ncbi:MAG: tetratricopeptide repeat protein, partial [Elusimicrobiota bacterium]